MNPQEIRALALQYAMALSGQCPSGARPADEVIKNAQCFEAYLMGQGAAPTPLREVA